MAGRPTLCTPENIAKVVAALEAGNYRVTAAGAAGIHRHTLENWEKRGVTGEEPYASFVAAMVAAEAKAEMELLAEIRSATKEIVWTSRAWIMERRFAGRWCGRVKQQTVEAVDALTDKLKSDPEVHRKVVEILAENEAGAAGASH